MFDRRKFLRTTGAALGVGAFGTLGAAPAAAANEWHYEFTSEALDAGARELVVPDNEWAYTATRNGFATVDVSNPALPVVAATVLGPGSNHNDLSVSGDLLSLANDGDAGSETNPAGVGFYDVSDPTAPVELSYYDDVASGIHNQFLLGDYAYVCENDSAEASFSESRLLVLDVSDPTAPVEVGSWKLRNHHPEMALTGLNPAHDVYVEDGLAYVAWWDAGTVVLDVSDPTDPVAVAHFGATDDATVAPDSTAEFYERYLGQPGNAHYVQPTPNGDYTLVGAETYPGPYEDTVIPGTHGGIKVFDTSDLASMPDDPTKPDPIGFIPAPDEPTGAPLRTSHNFEVTDSKLHAAWYQAGVRLFDLSTPTDPSQLAAWVSPDAQAYWGANQLTDGGDQYTIASERDGKGVTILDIVHETGSADGATDWPDLGPTDVLGPTMQEPL